MSRLTPWEAAQEEPILYSVVSEDRLAEQDQHLEGAYEAPYVGFVTTKQHHGSFVCNDILGQERGHTSAAFLRKGPRGVLYTDSVIETGQLSAKV